MTFLVTVYVLILIPGPSVLFVVSRGVALGSGPALATVVGNTSGLLLQLALVLAGLGPVVASSATASMLVRLLGGAYLVVLGLRSIRDRGALAAMLDPTAIAPRALPALIREGFAVGATNPKGTIILTAVLPAFVDPAQGRETLQLASMGIVVVALAAISDGVWALAAGAAREWFGRSQRRLEVMSTGGGLAMVALGVGVVVFGREH